MLASEHAQEASMRVIPTVLVLGLSTAACTLNTVPAPRPGGPYFGYVSSAAMIPGIPVSNSVPTMTDMWGHTVESPGMDLSHGGSTTQSLGADPPGTGDFHGH
jgi:hypothetical protein